jgi:hypothetical protein
VQETYATHPDIRAACDRGMSRHIAELTRDVEAAKKPRDVENPETGPPSAKRLFKRIRGDC